MSHNWCEVHLKANLALFSLLHGNEFGDLISLSYHLLLRYLLGSNVELSTICDLHLTLLFILRLVLDFVCEVAVFTE